MGMGAVMGTAVLPVQSCDPRKWGVGNGVRQDGGMRGGCQQSEKQPQK